MSTQDFKLVLSEVDGVLTDNSLFIDELGNVPFKRFCSEDFEAINEIKKKIPVVFLSADNRVSYNLFRKKNIPFYWEAKDKHKVVGQILIRYGVTADEVLFIASKLSDVKNAKMFTYSVCPSNANTQLKSICNVLSSGGGEGVITEVYLRYFKN